MGANVGDTVAFWRSVGPFPILAIEPTDKFGNVLARNSHRLGSVVIDRSTLGHVDADETTRLSVRHGTARLVSTHSLSSVARLSSVLARHPRFEDAKLLKIDTDGSDGAVVVGAREWLARRRPIVFFEFQPALSRPGTPTLLDAFDVLAESGYAQLAFYDNAGHFALSTSMLERDRVCELHAHADGWGEERYWDVAAFHGDDLDVYEALRGEELNRG
ncbi:hypothetical protein AYO48_03340 [Gaiella sp. SCGC AG-212-M14]|nr:hypothetical protein AYO48_03340 [Gaiella sp. SCGC AG-212-M14]